MHRFAITTAIAAPAASLLVLAAVWTHVSEIHNSAAMSGMDVPSAFTGLRGMSTAELDELLSASCTTSAGAAEPPLPALAMKAGPVFVPMSTLQSPPTRMISEIELQAVCQSERFQIRGELLERIIRSPRLAQLPSPTPHRWFRLSGRSFNLEQALLRTSIR